MRQFTSPAAFRAAVDARLRNYAREVGAPVTAIRRQAALERVMVRLMRVAPGRWALKGGLALDTRLRDRARRRSHSNAEPLDNLVRAKLLGGRMYLHARRMGPIAVRAAGTWNREMDLSGPDRC